MDRGDGDESNQIRRTSGGEFAGRTMSGAKNGLTPTAMLSMATPRGAGAADGGISFTGVACSLGAEQVFAGARAP
jgi:hypothetical protein